MTHPLSTLTRSMLLGCVLALAIATPTRAADMDETTGLVWSKIADGTTPEFNRRFRGEFTNEAVTATLDQLPPHDLLQISFQVFILRSWDGVNRSNNGGRNRVGPDFLRVGLDDGETDGRTLVHTCFSNTPVYPGFATEAAWQTYPSPVPGDRCPFMTGADLKNVLGYFFVSDPHPPEPLRQDAIYTLHMTLPHSAAKATVHFRGMGLQDIGDESWAIADLHVATLAKSAIQIPVSALPSTTYQRPDGTKVIVLRPTPESFAKLFQTAAGRDAMAANDAFWQLVAAGDDTAGFLAKNVKPIAVDSAKVKALAAPVYADAASKDEKDARIRALLALGSTIEPVLRDLRDESRETPSRLDWALMDLGVTPIDEPDLRQWILATRILEAIGTPEAKKTRAALIAAPAK